MNGVHKGLRDSRHTVVLTVATVTEGRPVVVEHV